MKGNSFTIKIFMKHQMVKLSTKQRQCTIVYKCFQNVSSTKKNMTVLPLRYEPISHWMSTGYRVESSEQWVSDVKKLAKPCSISDQKLLYDPNIGIFPNLFWFLFPASLACLPSPIQSPKLELSFSYFVQHLQNFHPLSTFLQNCT